MIAGIIHRGSGVGNQLHRYVMTRVLADDMGVGWGMINPEGVKVKDFMPLYTGSVVGGSFHIEEPAGKVIPVDHGMNTFEERRIDVNGLDVRGYDPQIHYVQDNTIIDGEFQDERYFSHRLPDIAKWLRVPFLGMPNNLCIIGFRGGEFKAIPELFLTSDYWGLAMSAMRDENPDMKFLCVTDDPETARAVLPSEVKITHDVATDWRMVRHARYLILSNSSFYILPALLNKKVQKVIAPMYWARRNTGGPWATRQNFYRKFTYI